MNAVLEKWAQPQPIALTVDDFMRLHEAGAFQNYAKTELIDGVIVAMNAQFGAHAHAKTQLLRRLADAVDAVMPGFRTIADVSVAIPPDHVPEPDIIVTNWAPVREAVPVATVALLIEVADTTQRYDLGKKAGIYAAAGVPEYWVVDLDAGAIYLLWAPAADGYRERRVAAWGEVIEAATIPNLAVDTAGL